MHAIATSTTWFGARTLVASALLVAFVGALAMAQQQPDGCRVECYPNTKLINGKGGAGKGDNCRWILRTDGKAARLCDHIKCRKVCPNGQSAATTNSGSQLQEAASTSDRIEQRLIESNDQPAQAAPQSGGGESMGIMRQLHGNKLAKAPVPGVAGGRLSASSVQTQQQQQQSAAAAGNGRRMAPTLPPSVQYDENDTPPPISRFLDISPEE